MGVVGHVIGAAQHDVGDRAGLVLRDTGFGKGTGQVPGAIEVQIDHRAKAVGAVQGSTKPQR